MEEMGGWGGWRSFFLLHVIQYRQFAEHGNVQASDQMVEESKVLCFLCCCLLLFSGGRAIA